MEKIFQSHEDIEQLMYIDTVHDKEYIKLTTSKELK